MASNTTRAPAVPRTAPAAQAGTVEQTRTDAAAAEAAAAGIEGRLRTFEHWFETVLPEHVPAAAFVTLLYGCLRKDKTLARAAAVNFQSFMIAATDCAQLGGIPGKTYHFLTFNNTDTGIPDITGTADYKLEIQLAMQSGLVNTVNVECVYAKDHFAWAPTRMRVPEHEIRDHERLNKDLVAVYAYAEYQGARVGKCVVLFRAEVMLHRKKAPSKKFWDGDWEYYMWMKGLAVDTPVPTPLGWRTMGDLREGDYVFDRDGQPTWIAAASEVKHLPCYQVTFTTGPPVICDEEHRWVARVASPGNTSKVPERTYDIGELYAAHQAGQRIVLPVAGPLDLPPADLPVDPWVLGYWLGDGNRTQPAVTCDAPEVAEVEAAIRAAGYSTHTRPDPRSDAVTINISDGLGKQLADLGLIGSKRVPSRYLRGSAEQRLAMLRGLMDADGSVWQRQPGQANRARFTNTDPGLASAVAELARSLGEQVHEHELDGEGFGQPVHSYVVSWTPTAVVPFALAAKANRTPLRAKASYGHRIESIELVESAPTRCIAVESPTHTFLAGRDMIPTHNTAVHVGRRYWPQSAAYQTAVMAATARALSAGGRMMALTPGEPEQLVPPGMPAITGEPAGEVLRSTTVENEADAEAESGWAATGALPASGNGNGGGPAADVAPAGPVDTGAGVAAGAAANGRTWPDVPLDGPVSRSTGGVLGNKWPAIGWIGDDYREMRRVMVGVLAAGRTGGQANPPLDITSPARLTERQARTAIVSFEHLARTAGDDMTRLAETMEQLYVAATSPAATAGQPAG